MNFKSLAALTLVASAAPLAAAGPLAYGVCQTGCNALAVTCYSAAGLTFGVGVVAALPTAGFTLGVAIVAAPPIILTCNAGLATCTAACAATALLAPIP